MLKIYLQIFGTIAVCLIMVLNYQVFIQKPNKEKIITVRTELTKLEEQNKVLDQILTNKRYFPKLEELHQKDYADVKIFFAKDFLEPRFMLRLQKLIELSGCKSNGIIVGKVTKAGKPNVYDNFISKKDELGPSIGAFIKAMKEFSDKPEKWNEIVGPDTPYSNRLLFYQAIGAGKKFPGSMSKGMETHRFNITLKGNYTSCKKFLYLISRNRPFIQATVQSFQPVGASKGADRIFNCRVLIVTQFDKNGELQTMPGTAPATQPAV